MFIPLEFTIKVKFRIFKGIGTALSLRHAVFAPPPADGNGREKIPVFWAVNPHKHSKYSGIMSILIG
jgi:hypothetical protein